MAHVTEPAERRRRAQRPTVRGRRYVIAAGHALACVAGQRMLESGGNAIDAGVAAGIANNVLQPDIAHFGGIAPIIVYRAATRTVHAVQGVGRWPAAASISAFEERGHREIPRGVLRCIVPAAPSSWLRALEEFGTKAFGEVAAPAIDLAEQGFPMYDFLAAGIRSHADAYATWPANSAIFLPQGRPPAPGELFVQADLARTLRTMAHAEGDRAAGSRGAGLDAARAAFYRGEIAQAMVRFSQQEGGLVSAEDLASLDTPVLPPCRVSYRGLDVYACGPWSQGPVLLQTLKILEGMPIGSLEHNSPEYVHAVVEALKLSFADRERYYGDPEFVRVPVDELLSDNYAERRRALIDPSRAWPELPPSGDGRRPIAAPVVPGHAGRTDTSYLCAIDADGNIFSATFSDGSYDVPVVPGLGIPMSSRGSQAWLDPAHPNSVQPRKRPMITPNPVLVLKDGTPYMAIGSPGGDVQPQAMVQVLFNMLHFGMDPQQAVEAPRFSTSSVPDSFSPHRYEPGVLRLEAEFAAETVQRLSAMGHRVVIRDPESYWLSGGVCVAVRDGRGLLSAGADPRRACYAVGW